MTAAVEERVSRWDMIAWGEMNISLEVDCKKPCTHQRLAFWVNARAMQRVTGNNVDVLGEVTLESCHLRSFARGLSSDDSTALGGYITPFSIRLHVEDSYQSHTSAISRHYSINVFSLDVVNSPITDSGDEMAVFKDGNIGLRAFSRFLQFGSSILRLHTLLANSSFNCSYLSGLSHALTLQMTQVRPNNLVLK